MVRATGPDAGVRRDGWASWGTHRRCMVSEQDARRLRSIDPLASLLLFPALRVGVVSAPPRGWLTSKRTQGMLLCMDPMACVGSGGETWWVHRRCGFSQRESTKTCSRGRTGFWVFGPSNIFSESGLAGLDGTLDKRSGVINPLSLMRYHVSVVIKPASTADAATRTICYAPMFGRPGRSHCATTCFPGLQTPEIGPGRTGRREVIRSSSSQCRVVQV